MNTMHRCTRCYVINVPRGRARCPLPPLFNLDTVHRGGQKAKSMQQLHSRVTLAWRSIPTDAFRQISDHCSMGKLREGSERNNRLG
jgi:hypothetical protein